MYPVSAKYRKAMKKQIRDKAYAQVKLGVFDKTASADCTLAFPPKVYYGKDLDLLGATVNFENYVTFENNRFRLDGTQRLMPLNNINLLPQGFISKEMSNANGDFSTPVVIIATFSILHSMVGLTLNFADDKPSKITIRSYVNNVILNTYVIETIPDDFFKAIVSLDGVNKIEIEFNKTAHPYSRARLNNILFGIGYEFSNKEIISISEKHTASPLSFSLPTSILTFTLDNSNDAFSMQNKTSISTFLSEGQEIELNYGQTLEDNTIEWVRTHKWYLSDWSASQNNATFKANGIFEELNKTMWEKSIFKPSNNPYNNGIQEFNSVLQDTNFKAETVFVQSPIRANEPLPVVSHAEALQILTNANLCALSETYDGKIKVSTVSNKIFLSQAFDTGTNITNYSSITLTDVLSNEYATFEKNFFKVDGKQIFVPKSSSYLQNEIVYSKLADANGNFGDKDRYTITTKSLPSHAPVLTCVEEVTLIFPEHQIPKEILIYSYEDNSANKTVYYHPTKAKETYIIETSISSTVGIIITKGMPNTRARIQGFLLGRVDIIAQNYNEPQYKIKPVVKEIVSCIPAIVLYLNPTHDDQRTLLVKSKIPSDGTFYRFKHDMLLNGELRVLDATVTKQAIHYGFVSYIKLTTPDKREVEFEIFTNKYFPRTIITKLEVAPKGELFEWESPSLVYFSEEYAIQYLEQINSYFQSRVLMSLETRGNPEYNVLDVFPLSDKSWGVIEEIETTFNGAFRGKMVLRKEFEKNELDNT